MAMTSRQAPLWRERGSNWVHESPLMHIAWEEEEDAKAENDKRKRRRVHSLKYLSMRRLLSDQRYLDKGTFRGVPWMLAGEMWNCLGKWYTSYIEYYCCWYNKDSRTDLLHTVENKRSTCGNYWHRYTQNSSGIQIDAYESRLPKCLFVSTCISRLAMIVPRMVA